MDLTHEILVRICDRLRWQAVIGSVAATSRALYNACHRRHVMEGAGPSGPFIVHSTGVTRWRAGLVPGRDATPDGWCAADTSIDAVRHVAYNMRQGDLHVKVLGDSEDVRRQLTVLGLVDGCLRLSMCVDPGPDSVPGPTLEIVVSIGRVRSLQVLHIDSSDLRGLVQALGQTCRPLPLRELRLCDCHLSSPGDVEALNLWQIPLDSLDLEHNALGLTNLEALARTIPPSLDQLYLAAVNPDGASEATRHLLSAVARPTRLSHLCLESNSIGFSAEGSELLTDALRQQPHLMTLSLESNELGRRLWDVRTVSSALTGMHELQHLRLCHNPLGEMPGSIAALALALVGKPLRELRLNQTLLALRQSHLPDLSPALGTLRFLQELHLRDNYIGRHRADLRALVGAGLSQLQCLYLADNLLGRHLYIDQVLGMLGHLKHLTHLDLCRNLLGDEEHLEAAPTELPHRLRVLWLRENTIGTGRGDTRSLAAILERLPSLEKLDLSDNAISRLSDVVALSGAVRRVRRLTQVELADNPLWALPYHVAVLIKRLGPMSYVVADAGPLATALWNGPSTGVLPLIRALVSRQLVNLDY